MQNFLVAPTGYSNEMQEFEFVEEEKMDEIEKIDHLMRDQEETDYEDMIATNLVKFEYDIFKQIKSQLQKKTNALFLIGKQLAREFIACYSEYTLLDGTAKMDKTTINRKTQRMKS